MFELSRFPAAEVRFNRHAALDSGAGDLADLAAANLTDLVFVSHGWNNDLDEARSLYRRLAASLSSALGSVDGLTDRRLGLACVFWPSKRFAEAALVPGGAAAATSPISEAHIRQQIDELREVFPSPDDQVNLDKMADLVVGLTDRTTARAEFADLARQLVDDGTREPEDGSPSFFDAAGADLMTSLSIPITLVPPDHGARAAGLGDVANLAASTTHGTAAGFGQVLGGWLGAARNLLNFTTYYRMKTRAGEIGERALAPLVNTIHTCHPDLRLHLVGHSFGGRLVAATVRALPRAEPGPVATLTLLQAAFSHYGLSQDTGWGQPGHFRAVLDNNAVRGPSLITHTRNDTAVGIMYAIASRIAGQNASALGDANDRFGGIGRNGAQRTDEAVTGSLLAAGDAYSWQPGALHNLVADTFIANHSDVTGRAVAYAILSAMATT